MHRLERTVALLALAWAGSSPLPAQGDDANVIYRHVSVPPAPTSPSGFADFTANQATVRDTLYQHLWYYRVDSDGRESAFNNGDTNGDGTNTQGYSRGGAGNTLVLRWSDVDERGLLAATLTIASYSTGATSGLTTSRLELQNRTSAPIRINVFHYVDVDLCTPANVVTVNAAGNRHTITNPAAQPVCNEVIEVVAVGHDLWEVDSYPRIRDRLVDATVHDLAPGNRSFSGDYSGAFQWRNRTIAPGASLVCQAVISHNHSPCERAAASERYGHGSGGALGPPRIETRRAAILGATAELVVDNAPPGAVATMIGGFGRTAQRIGNITLWTSPLADAPVAIGANGSGSLRLTLPNSASLCGLPVDFECLIVDQSVSGPYPISHTDGIEWTLGGL